MLATSPFLIFASTVCLWALFDGLVYAALRFIRRSCDYGLRIFGSLSLALLLILFCAVALLAGADNDGNWSWNRDSTLFILGGGFLSLLTLSVGGAVMRLATRKQMIWWHGVLFCALYFVLAHGIVIYFCNTRPAIMRMMSNSFDAILASFGFSSYLKDFFIGPLVLLIVCAFPLIAPLIEMFFRSSWRAWQQNKTGSYA